MSDEKNKIVPMEGRNELKNELGSELKNELKKPRGRKKAEILNAALDSDEKKQLMTATLHEVMIEANQPKVMSDNQLRDRLNNYLNRCMKAGQYPTVEEGLLATGYTYQYMMDIAQGKSRGKYFTPDAAEIISRFVHICATVDAKMVMSNKIPMIGYIFRSKQHMGYTDKTEVAFNATVSHEQELSLEEIEKRYAVETEFAEQSAENAEQK